MESANRYVERAAAYVDGVLDGSIPACVHVRRACQRHHNDLERAKADDFPYYFNAHEAYRVCRFGEMLPHVKGEWARKRDDDPPKFIHLEPWECFVLCSLFGWLRKKDDKRRFNLASIYVPRKNGKSTLAAIVGWWLFAKDEEPGAEVYCGATTEKQAWEVFGPARSMAVQVPKLPEELNIEVRAKSLFCAVTNSKFEPVIGDPGDGASVHGAIVDEFHEHADSALRDTMLTGMAARRQPLLLTISTAGDNISGPCREDWEDCVALLAGSIQDETHFAIIWTIDDGDDWASEAALRKANPNWGVSIITDILLSALEAARRDPKKQTVFKTKHLNVWGGALGGWLNLETWNACAEPAMKPENFKGRKAFVGIDAASRLDLTSMVALLPPDKDGLTRCFGRHYIPEATAERPENAHYRKFIADGLLVATPGARVDFTIIEADLQEWAALFQVRALLYDPRELTDLVNRVGTWASFPRIEVGQSPLLISEPMKEVEAMVEAKTIRHNGDRVLAWQAGNVVKKKARGGGEVKYYFPTKTRAALKIDGMVALIMAQRGTMTASPEPYVGFAMV